MCSAPTWSRASSCSPRARLRSACFAVASRSMAATATIPVLNYIGGEWAPSSSGETVPDRNPAHTDEILGEVTVSTADDVRRAVDAAAAAFREWRATPAPQRGDIVRKAADQMERRRDELGRLLTQEEGKTLPESLAEVDRAIANVRFAAGQGARLVGETIPSSQRGTFVYTVREPLGVVACITPWNFPIAIPAWKIAPALVAGNTVVLKPASLTPLCAAEVVRCFVAAGLPNGALNLVLGTGEALSRAITSDERIKAISFTGSSAVGRRLYAQAAERLCKVKAKIDDGKRSGAKVIRDGGEPTRAELRAGYFVEPTIFSDVDPRMPLAQEEIFGPVVSVISARDLDAALAAANGVGYGLSSAIYTNDLRTAFRYADESEAGMLHVNTPTVGGEPQVPFGGVKDSGFGDRECGTAAF